MFCHPALGSATPPWVVHRVVPRVPSPPKNKTSKNEKNTNVGWLRNVASLSIIAIVDNVLIIVVHKI